MAYLRGMGCCALTEITGLKDSKNAPEAMRTLCRDRAANRWTAKAKPHQLKPFGNVMIFTGVVSNRSKTDIPRGGYTYGPRFAKFIEKEGLGEVTLVAKAYNSLNHPGHLVATWVWKPDNEAIQEWWEKDQRGKKPTTSKEEASWW